MDKIPLRQTQAESDHLNRKLSENFIAREFICPCCKEEGVRDELVIHLQLAHNFLPNHSVIIINSAFRCEKHNKDPKVGGSDTSSHLVGLAADIKCEYSTYRYHLLSALLQAGFKRIGIGEKFIHVDLDETKPQKVIWDY